MILGINIGWGCSCATSWCDFDLTLDFAPATLAFDVAVFCWKPRCVGGCYIVGTLVGWCKCAT